MASGWSLSLAERFLGGMVVRAISTIQSDRFVVLALSLYVTTWCNKVCMGMDGAHFMRLVSDK